MSGAVVVFRREVAAYFNAPIAYVVAIGFMLLNSGLFVLDFWIVGELSMRGFFEWVSWTACFVIPAITMRSWAEDKRGGTYELLLTLPLRSLDLVAGKFVAALVFYLFCLSGSLVIPAALATLATPGMPPDWGAIVAGYLGAALVGGLLIAIGLFLSGLCRDQIEAFIVTLVAVLTLKLVGFSPIAAQVDSVVGGLGSFLRESVSFSMPLGRFARGLLDFGDVAYFVIWTAAFLFLNGVGLEGRLKPGSRPRYLAAVGLGLPAALLLVAVIGPLAPRVDLTADRLYTVSDAAVRILDDVPEGNPVRIRLYFSPRDEMPAALRTLERDVHERIEAMQRRVRGRIVADVVHLHADEAILAAIQEAREGALDEESEDGRGAVERQLLQEGVAPFRVRTGGLTGTETKVVYAALTLSHGAAAKEVIPQVSPGTLVGLEKDLMTRVHRLIHGRTPVVGLLAPIQSMDIDPGHLNLLAQLGVPAHQLAREQDDHRLAQVILGQADQYEIRRLRPGQEGPLTDGLDTLVILRPEGLREHEAREIQRFLHRGGSVVMAVQAFEGSLRPTRHGASVALSRVEHGAETLLGRYGLSVPHEMVLEPEFLPVSYSTGPFGPPVTVSFHWIFKIDAGNFVAGSPLAAGIGGTSVAEAISPVRVDEGRLATLGLQATTFLHSTPGAWTREVPTFAVPPDLNQPQPPAGPIPFGVWVQGRFPDPDAEGQGGGEVEPGTGPTGNLIVIGTARPFADDQVVEGAGRVAWSGLLLKNAVDVVSLGEVLLRLPLREPLPRPLRPVERGEMLLYQFILVGLAPLVYLGLGLTRLAMRRRLQQRVYAKAAGGSR